MTLIGNIDRDIGKPRHQPCLTLRIYYKSLFSIVVFESHVYSTLRYHIQIYTFIVRLWERHYFGRLGMYIDLRL